MRRQLCMLLSLVVLFTALTTAVSAKTVYPADVTRDGEVTLTDTLQLFNAVAGRLSLSPHETALADSNHNARTDIGDVIAAFYHVSGIAQTLPEAVEFDAHCIDIADTAHPLSQPLPITSEEELAALFALHGDVSPYAWTGLSYDLTREALIAVPLSCNDCYIATVSTKGDTLYIATVTASDPDVAAFERTAYAFVAVAKDTLDGKAIKVIDYTDNNAAFVDADQSVSSQFYAADQTGCLWDITSDGENGAVLTLSFTMPSSGYTVNDVRYVKTADALIVTCDITVPLGSDIAFTALESFTVTVPIADYNGQELVLCERRRARTQTVTGEPLAFETVFAEDLFYSDVEETEAQLITSREELEAAYTADAANAPDYTEGFDDAYFEDHALILVKAYFHVLPYSVIIDSVGIDSTVMTVTVRFTTLDYYSPALYHGRFLVQIAAEDAQGIEAVDCQTYVETIQTL